MYKSVSSRAGLWLQKQGNEDLKVAPNGGIIGAKKV
jgi:hypothetical protein